jgi:UDP-3-O-[3-hydroxymyristoyl] glucosamine N-acyltransferase
VSEIKYRLDELAERVNGELRGDGDITITGVGHVEDAQPGQIAFVDGPKLLPVCESCNASAIIVPPDVEIESRPFIVTEDPRLAFSQILELFAPERRPEPGIHATAVLGGNVSIGERVSIGAHCYVGDDAIIGDDAVIHPLVYIGPEACMGRGCEVYPQAYIGPRVKLGRRVIIHAGAAVGADGFGFLQTEEGHRKIPQIGTAIIDDDVEIGANSTVDRATIGVTRIGAGTKIDDQVHVAHNVVIGRNCLLCGQVGIAGSSKIGDNVVMGGQVGINDHVEIGNDIVLGAQAGVFGDLDKPGIYSGYPARPHNEQLRLLAQMRRLPDLVGRIKELERMVGELRERLGDATSAGSD